MRITLSLIFGFALNSAPPATFAHHGVGGQFDLSQEYEVSGIVTDIAWVNPHSYVYFDVTNDDGEVENWRCELRSGVILERSGWSQDMFAPGTQVTILGSPARREANTCYVETIAFNGGEPLYRYAQLNEGEAAAIAQQPQGVIPARLANGRPNISGDWAIDQVLYSSEQVRRSFGEVRIRGAAPEGGPPGMGIPGGGPAGMGMGPGRPATIELTEAGRQAAAAAVTREIQTDADGRPLQSGTGVLDCQPRSFFRDWTFDQHTNRITQRGDTITLQYGFMDTLRTIHMDMNEHPEDLQAGPAGHSIGRWEDDVLVVDTIGITSGQFGSPTRNDTIRSDQYRVIERFTLDAENQTLTRNWVAEDPLYWANTASGQDVVKRADIAWRPYGCDDRTNENVTN